MNFKRRLSILSLLFVGVAFLIVASCSKNDENEEKVPPTIPVVSTNDAYNITFTTAEVGGAIVSNGNAPITGSGFCWSKNHLPTTNDTKSTDGSQSGSFRTNMTNLEEGTTYYVRAYATNSVGTGYGEEKTFTTELSCHTKVLRHPGYQVWAGDTPYFQLTDHYDYFYNIDKHGYKLIGEGTTTQSFNTGAYKYYVIVASYWCCVDAIQFNDGTYYDHGQGYALYTGLTDVSQILGAPDGKFGKFGYNSLCPPNNASFNGFITDDATIISRGGGLKVIVGSGCQ